MILPIEDLCEGQEKIFWLINEVGAQDKKNTILTEKYM